MEGRGDVRDGARRGATARAGIGARARTRRDVRRDAVLRGARATTRENDARWPKMGTARAPTRVVGGERTSGRLVTSPGGGSDFMVVFAPTVGRPRV